MTQNNTTIYAGRMLIALDDFSQDIVFKYYSFDNKIQGEARIRKKPLVLYKGCFSNVLNRAVQENYEIVLLNSEPVKGFDINDFKPVKKELVEIIESELQKARNFYEC